MPTCYVVAVHAGTQTHVSRMLYAGQPHTRDGARAGAELVRPRRQRRGTNESHCERRWTDAQFGRLCKAPASRNLAAPSGSSMNGDNLPCGRRPPGSLALKTACHGSGSFVLDLRSRVEPRVDISRFWRAACQPKGDESEPTLHNITARRQAQVDEPCKLEPGRYQLKIFR